MLRLTLAQMRRSIGRLTAAAVAIMIGTAFVAATLLTGGVITRTSYDAVTASFGDADLVVTGQGATQQLDAVRGTEGVEAADALLLSGVELTQGAARYWQTLVGTTTDPALSSLVVTEGRLPVGTAEVALPQSTLDRFSLALGDSVDVVYAAPDAPVDGGDDEAALEWSEHRDPVEIVGVADDPAGAWKRFGDAALASPEALAAWDTSVAEGGSTVLVLAPEDTASIASTLAAQHPELQVQTKDEAAAEEIAAISGGGNVIVSVVLGFAAIALVVAGLVISNTFQVLVAQRTRTLALLRCVGAVRGQLRRSVLLEAGILGAVASLAGLLLGVGITQVALVALGGADLEVPLPATVDVTPAVVLAPLLVGVLVTVLASLVPARTATRVSPIAALRPLDAPELGSRAGKVRLVVSLLLAVGGVGGLLLAVAAAREVDPASLLVVLAFGVLSGAVSFVGVLLGAVFWVPRVVSVAGAGLARTGTSARLAAANTVRNPRRTAATSTALLIGVTLVALMSTGAASARSSLAQSLDQLYPVDMVVQSGEWTGDEQAALPADVVATVSAVDGVAAVAPVRTTVAQVDGETWTVAEVTPEAATLLRDDAALDELAPGVVLLPVDGPDGPATVVGPDGRSVTLTAYRTGDSVASQAYVDPETMRQIAADPATTTLWVTVEPDANPADVQFEVEQSLSTVSASVVSDAAERRGNEDVIDTLLAVVVGLLAVAVVIALVGVANTLSLSVIERRRESATLRAIGLSRRQLRATLAIEGMLIAGVGALLGVGLGMLYGWAGAAVVFGTAGDLQLSVPWGDLGIVLAVAVAAGLLASVVPGRAAARTPPVAALAVD